MKRLFPSALPRLLWCAALGAAVLAPAAPPNESQLAAWFLPDRVGQAALAPDGRHLAYVVHEDGKTTIVLADVDDPSKGAVVPVGDDAYLRDSKDLERTPLRVPFFQWATADRLVFSSEIPALPTVDLMRSKEPTNSSVIYAVDADGRNLTRLANEDDVSMVTTEDDPDADTAGQDGVTLPREPRVVGFADDPTGVLVEATRPALYAGSNDPDYFGRVATGLFEIDIRTGKRRVLQERDVNGTMLYDRQGHGRVEALRPIDGREKTFVYLVPPRGVADSKGLSKLLGDPVTPANYLGARTFPLAFDYGPNLLYLASNAGRDSYGIYALDLKTGTRTAVAEEPGVDLADFSALFSDAPLVFDRGRRRLVGVRGAGLDPLTRWLDPELAAVQATLSGKFPQRSVEVVGWDEGRARFLALVSGGNDPGRYFIYDRGPDRLVQFLRRDPYLDLDEINASAPFSIPAAGGARLTGYLTIPRHPVVNPPPVLVRCHGGPWERAEPGFDRDAQVLAAMGFVVVDLNYRGSAGFGTRYREALRQDVDAGPVEDIRTAVAWVAGQRKIDGKRIALLGEGFGGYVVLRALQLYPDDFRCGVAINAPTDLKLWCVAPESWQEKQDRQDAAINDMRQTQQFMTNFGGPAIDPALAPTALRAPSYAQEASLGASTSGPGGSSGGSHPLPPRPAPTPVNFPNEVRRWYFGTDTARLAEHSPARHPDLLTKPVLLVQDPFDLDGESGEAAALRAALGHTQNPAEYLEVTGAFGRGLPAARAAAYVKIEDFFNLNLYDFNVKLGQPTIVK